MRRFNPTAPARVAIGEGLIYQQAGRSVFKKLSAGADLNPGSQQLVVGGIGSGKTTELMLAERDLSGNEKVLPLYIDVSAETDLSTVNSGSLLASLGMHLCRAVMKLNPPEDLNEVYTAIRNAAYGHEKQVWVPDYPERDYDDFYWSHPSRNRVEFNPLAEMKSPHLFPPYSKSNPSFEVPKVP